MVHKIHSLHPEPLVVYSLQSALAHGTLETVQWIIEHRHDRLCCGAGIQNLCCACLRRATATMGKHDLFRVLQWLTLHYASAVLDGSTHAWIMQSVEFVRWLDDTDRLEDEVAEDLLDEALHHCECTGADTLLAVRYLVEDKEVSLAHDRIVSGLTSSASQPHKEPLVEYVVSSGLCDSLRGQFAYAATRPDGAKVLQWTNAFVNKSRNQFSLERQAMTAVYYSHLDTLQYLVEKRGCEIPSLFIVEPTNETLCAEVYKWMHATGGATFRASDMDTAANYGYLELVKWFHEHRSEGCTRRAMDLAARGGHLHVVQWLDANRTEGCTTNALNYAAVNGHLHIVQWLYTNRPPHDCHITTAMASAAYAGELEVLMWLYETSRTRGDGGCTVCRLRALLQEPHTCNRRGYMSSYGHPTNLPVLNCLRWLHARPQPRTGCQRRCFEQQMHDSIQGDLLSAAYQQGDVAVVGYLESQFVDDAEFTAIRADPNALAQCALAESGHLAMLQRLFTRYGTAITWRFVQSNAVAIDRDDILEWLESVGVFWRN